jgi:amidase
MVPLALGSDLAGSLRIPVAFCGIYSLRPTPNVVETDGCIPPCRPSQNLLVNGPIANSVEMLQRFMCVMQGEDFTKDDNRDLRIAITPQLDGIETDFRIRDAIMNLSKRLNKFSCSVTNGSPSFFNAAQELRQLYVRLSMPITNDINAIIYPKQKPITIDPVEFENDLKRQKQLRHDFEEAFFNDYDIWILPACCTLAFPHNEKRDKINIKTSPSTTKPVSYWKTIAYATPLTVLGNPIVTLPIGNVINENGKSIPIGVQIVGKRGKDQQLLRYAYQLDQVLNAKSKL